MLLLLGAWGGLIPFIGPYFHYAYTPSSAWSYTSGRLWLELLPAVGAVAGGLILVASSSRSAALFGAWLAGISGAGTGSNKPRPPYGSPVSRRQGRYG
jgi:hypothetical protein